MSNISESILLFEVPYIPWGDWRSLKCWPSICSKGVPGAFYQGRTWSKLLPVHNTWRKNKTTQHGAQAIYVIYVTWPKYEFIFRVRITTGNLFLLPTQLYLFLTGCLCKALVPVTRCFLAPTQTSCQRGLSGMNGDIRHHRWMMDHNDGRHFLPTFCQNPKQ